MIISKCANEIVIRMLCLKTAAKKHQYVTHWQMMAYNIASNTSLHGVRVDHVHPTTGWESSKYTVVAIYTDHIPSMQMNI